MEFFHSLREKVGNISRPFYSNRFFIPRGRKIVYYPFAGHDPRPANILYDHVDEIVYQDLRYPKDPLEDELRSRVKVIEHGLTGNEGIDATVLYISGIAQYLNKKKTLNALHSNISDDGALIVGSKWDMARFSMYSSNVEVFDDCSWGLITNNFKPTEYYEIMRKAPLVCSIMFDLFRLGHQQRDPSITLDTYICEYNSWLGVSKDSDNFGQRIIQGLQKEIQEYGDEIWWYFYEYIPPFMTVLML